ncbi:SUMF1/EgtB/PvdO family nonheme iron enzyme [Candidatus Poribacteria bacterium]|nr:SUMF1/EgtB/PvdO family nonheme iron enzyme [Candidatus Poribacteria bacterium]
MLDIYPLSFALLAFAASIPESKVYENSIGMKFTRIEPGSFIMGQEDGDFDERPVHKVNITKPFYMAVTEVTNQQYEEFNPDHKKLRGKRGFSKDDDEAVIFVNWHEAVDFCKWLGEKESLPYRLPTEAEWEYACRAGTQTPYNTGDEIPKMYHKHQEHEWDPVPVPLHVGKTKPNAWGLYDMHGNVEEWCHDWYGRYIDNEQTDPVGMISGTMKVTRGGSHNTTPEFLRSANRLGTLPEDKSWLIGFRVVLGEMPETKPLPPPDPKLWAVNVSQDAYKWTKGPDEPYFKGPVEYVKYPPDRENIPMYDHNHCPSITWCENGDLLAVWFSTIHERGRELTILASRLRQGNDEWDDPAEFFKAPDRNMTGSALYYDGKGKLYHFNGLEAGARWANLALTLQTSTDNGVTWSHPELICPEHQPRNQVISGTFRTKEGYLIQPCDAVYSGNGGTAIHISKDEGETWYDPGAGTPKPDFKTAKTGGTIAGIHAGVTQLKDGSLMAFGRGDNRLGSDDNIGERMPKSMSGDMGETWSYTASEFPPIDGGQRVVLMRLIEGPILFISFTDSSRNLDDPEGLVITDSSGEEKRVYGLFAALSFDEGQTWSVKKLITAGDVSKELDGGAWTRNFTMDATHAEPRGYMAATQSPDGMIHLISSRLYYKFNLAWLKAE